MYRLATLLILILSFYNASGQAYEKELTRHKVTINELDQTLVFFTEPVKHDIVPKQNRVYTWYSAGKINHTQGGYNGRLLNGSFNSFYLNKNLSEQGMLEKGVRHGEWKCWYPNGSLKEINQWRAGLKNGIFQEFDEEGLVTRTGRYINGQINGNVKVYAAKDSISFTRYRNGQLVQKKETMLQARMKQVKARIKRLLPKKKAKEPKAP